MNKLILRDAILAQLRAELARQTRAAWLARDEATNEESRAESKYDTHGQEAAYLAEGQARLAVEVEESISLYATLALPDFAPDGAIALGALVGVESSTGPMWYFLGPRAGGLELEVGGQKILVVTPASPLGRQLLGRHGGDSIAAPAKTPTAALRIVAVS